MTAFITGDCGCVHVNMEYRRMGAGGGLDDTKAPYLQMLDDIQSAIEYLQSHAATYHIDASKIALMGWSAGGHLALLYAYMAKQGNYNYGDNIQLVISEAGPTDFTGEDFEKLPYGAKAPVLKLVNYNTALLPDASPITYASANSPYTILMYGGTDTNNDNIIDEGSNDSIVAYSQGEDLHKRLSPEGQTVNSTLFLFEYPYVHGSFEADKDINGDNIDDPFINSSNSNFAGYYRMMENKLKNL